MNFLSSNDSNDFTHFSSKSSYFKSHKQRKLSKKLIIGSYIVFLGLFSTFITVPFMKGIGNGKNLVPENTPVSVQQDFSTNKTNTGNVLGTETMNLDNVVPNYDSAVLSQAEMQSNLAYAIDKFLASKNSPWYGLGSYIVSEGNRIGVDPKLFVSIAGVESGWCRVIPINDDGTKTFNCLGWNKRGRYFQSFKSWQDGITGVMQGFRNGYGTNIDVKKIKDIYCTSCVGSSNWSQGIIQYIDEINRIYTTL